MSQTRTPGASRLCVVLACFAGRSTAGRARREFGKAMRGDAATVLDEVVVVVDAKGRARVHDPHRAVAGTLTSALTWGAFGLVASGGWGLVIWGVLGAICGGAYAYFSEHVLTKRELQHIGRQLPSNSSALVAYVDASDENVVLAHASKRAAAASAVVITPDLDAHAATAATANPHPGEQDAVTMLLVRYAGEHTARRMVAEKKVNGANVELIFEVPRDGRTRVVSPTAAVAAMAKSDIVSWGGFGVVFGLIVAFGGNGGTFGVLEEGVVKGVLWGVFGLAAGALYGLLVGRATFARRIRGLQALLPPDTSTAVIWLARDGDPEVADEARASEAHLNLEFRPSGDGAVLQVS